MALAMGPGLEPSWGLAQFLARTRWPLFWRKSSWESSSASRSVRQLRCSAWLLEIRKASIGRSIPPIICISRVSDHLALSPPSSQHSYRFRCLWQFSHSTILRICFFLSRHPSHVSSNFREQSRECWNNTSARTDVSRVDYTAVSIARLRGSYFLAVQYDKKSSIWFDFNNGQH